MLDALDRQAKCTAVDPSINQAQKDAKKKNHTKKKGRAMEKNQKNKKKKENGALFFPQCYDPKNIKAWTRKFP